MVTPATVLEDKRSFLSKKVQVGGVMLEEGRNDMATNKEFIEYFQEQLAASGVGEIFCRKMFGDYGIYCDGVFFALVCDDTFFVKVTEAGRAILGENYPMGLAYSGAKTPMFRVEDFEDRDLMRELVRATCDELMVTTKKIKKN